MKGPTAGPMLIDSPESSIWVFSFEDAGLKKFAEHFLKLEADPSNDVIPIFISSYGGSVHNCLAMRDIIRSSNKKVATVAIGKAMSAGAALLAAGNKGMRFVSPDTTVMLHEVSSAAWGKNTDLQISGIETERLNNLFLTNLASDMGITLESLKKRFHDMKNADWFLSSKEAVKLGIADHVHIPRLVEGMPERGLVAFSKEEALKPKSTKRRKR